jgi:quercetin dioxygenase-like cupin family protein
MLYEEAKKALIRERESNYYEQNLRDSHKKSEENQRRPKVLKPTEMPWENCRQGIIKHLFNEEMNLPVESVDAYMQFIPPGSRSGKHRHMSEEYIFVLEGKGYDLHWDVDFELLDKYYWKVDAVPSRWQWEQGDSIYIPPNTVHQHFNRDPDKPVRFISATSRIVRHIGFDDLEQIEDAPEYPKKTQSKV